MSARGINFLDKWMMEHLPNAMTDGASSEPCGVGLPKVVSAVRRADLGIRAGLVADRPRLIGEGQRQIVKRFKMAREIARQISHHLGVIHQPFKIAAGCQQFQSQGATSLHGAQELAA